MDTTELLRRVFELLIDAGQHELAGEVWDWPLRDQANRAHFTDDKVFEAYQELWGGEPAELEALIAGASGV
jgi:hypothetical protein